MANGSEGAQRECGVSVLGSGRLSAPALDDAILKGSVMHGGGYSRRQIDEVRFDRLSTALSRWCRRALDHTARRQGSVKSGTAPR